MFYVKTQVGDETEINAQISDENVYTRCPKCEQEHAVDLEAILKDGGSLLGSVCLCSKCSEDHLRMQELIRQKENA